MYLTVNEYLHADIYRDVSDIPRLLLLHLELAVHKRIPLMVLEEPEKESQVL